MVKVIASSIRKGNVIEHEDGKLYVVMNSQNIHPGKGTPVTQVEMRRIVDGIKITERYKTTDSVEKAFVEEIKFNYLYDDGDNFVFMNPENYEQMSVPKDVLGNDAVYLQENMEVWLTIFNEVALACTLPTRVVLEITDTEPTVKGQTASSSYKPATLENGVRTLVPPYLTAGTKIVVMTEDGSYVERAKEQ
ncbi:elongation factor P [Pseudaquidulcibacter saccharophilus]|uniref:elongation factor P n=1 Tax=Pseudaquidulcibacter saccharophilus TaxID=2831900 RepID=UPI001EFF4C62|nr:elongation factor P [Pseudaquidulcibacter saccharophilus]